MEGDRWGKERKFVVKTLKEAEESQVAELV